MSPEQYLNSFHVTAQWDTSLIFLYYGRRKMFYLFFRVQKPHVIQSFQMTEQFRDKKEMQLLTVAVQTIPVL